MFRKYPIDNKILSGHRFKEVTDEYSSSANSRLVTFVNPFSYYLLKDSQLLVEVDTIFSDGALHTFLHKLVYRDRWFRRASFDYSSIAEDVFQFAANNGLKVALIGGRRREINDAVEKIRARFSGIQISLYRSGYFDSKQEVQEFVRLTGSSDVVIIGTGTPFQEGLGCEIKKTHPRGKLIFTCGGFLSQVAMRDDYYFPWVKKTGLRWLQRAILHSHVRKRLAVDYPRFIVQYLLERLGA